MSYHPLLKQSSRLASLIRTLIAPYHNSVCHPKRHELVIISGAEECSTAYWVHDENVDSAAMLIAYQLWLLDDYELHSPTRRRLGLYVVLHHGRPQVRHRQLPVPMVSGEARDCTMCNVDNGQWEFCWYNRAWRFGYLQFAQRGAWQPPGDGTRGDPLQVTSNTYLNNNTSNWSDSPTSSCCSTSSASLGG